MHAFPFLIIGFLAVGSAHAADPVQFSIPWFEMDEHNGARQKMIQLCRDNHRYYESKEFRPMCDNAEMAESRRYSKRIAGGLNELNTLQWWKENRDLRFSTLQACRRRAPYDRDMLQYCDLAREAEQAMGRRVRG